MFLCCHHHYIYIYIYIYVYIYMAIHSIVYLKNWWNGSLRNRKNYPFFFDQFFILLLSIYYLLVSKHDKRNYDADKRNLKLVAAVEFASFHFIDSAGRVHTQKLIILRFFIWTGQFFWCFFGLQQRIRYKISCINCYTPVTA